MLKRLSIGLVRWISAFFRVLGARSCRFHPSCSEYSAHAFEKLSWMRAVAWTLSRILRCNPFSRGGFDPVPEKRT